MTHVDDFRCEVNTLGGANQSPGRANTAIPAPVPVVFFLEEIWGPAVVRNAWRSPHGVLTLQGLYIAREPIVTCSRVSLCAVSPDCVCLLIP